MANAGGVPFQGCAICVSRLNQDGTITSGSSTGMIVDDKPFMKFTAKPSKDTGVEAVPKSACGDLLIAYKDRDRTKRWDITLDFGDADFEKREMISGFGLITAPASPGRTFSDGGIVTGQPYLASPALATFVATDVGRPIVGLPAPSLTSATPSASGGTLTAGTYYYEITAVNATGETTVSNEVSAVTTGSTSSVVLVWASVTGATGYKVYRSSTLPGAELLLATVGAVTTYTDTAPGTPSGSPPAANSTTPVGIPPGTYVASFQSATQVTMSAAATATNSSLSVTLDTLTARTVGSSWPRLLLIENPFGVAIEMWQKYIVRGTGYQGTTPYASAGSLTLPPSAYIRLGVFRAFLDIDAIDIEDKESMDSYIGWAIENPGFGLGPRKDWTTTATAGSGVAVDTTKVMASLADYRLPSPRNAGYQTTV